MAGSFAARRKRIIWQVSCCFYRNRVEYYQVVVYWHCPMTCPSTVNKKIFFINKFLKQNKTRVMTLQAQWMHYHSDGHTVWKPLSLRILELQYVLASIERTKVSGTSVTAFKQINPREGLQCTLVNSPIPLGRIRKMGMLGLYSSGIRIVSMYDE